MSNNDNFDDFIFKVNDEPEKKNSKVEDKYKTFELYSFLEEELHRLERRSLALEEASYILKNYPQSEILLEKIIVQNEKKQEEFLRLCLNPNHMIWNSLSETFESFFKHD